MRSTRSALRVCLPLWFQNSYLIRLKGIRATLETSPFFKCHEVTLTFPSSGAM